MTRSSGQLRSPEGSASGGRAWKHDQPGGAGRHHSAGATSQATFELNALIATGPPLDRSAGGNGGGNGGDGGKLAGPRAIGTIGRKNRQRLGDTGGQRSLVGANATAHGQPATLGHQRTRHPRDQRQASRRQRAGARQGDNGRRNGAGASQRPRKRNGNSHKPHP